MAEQHPPRNARWPYNRVPTVRDLAVRRCFICLDEDSSRDNTQGFVHACNCTLVAHERCLLAWTASAPSGGDIDRTKCAQCGAKYSITLHTPPILRLLDGAQYISRRAGGLLLIGSVGGLVVGIAGSAYITSVAYGCYAARWMLGRRLWLHAMDPARPSRWNPTLWIIMPSVPLAFLWASSGGAQIGWMTPSGVNALAVTLASAAPVRPLPTSAVLGAGAWTILGRAIGRVFADWPPSPFFLSLVFPFVRVAYRRALARFQLPRPQPEAAAPRPQPARREPGQPRQVFVNVLRGADADLHVQVGDREDAAAVDVPHGVAIGRTIGEMLLLPPLSGWVGQLLTKIPWSWTRAFLCVGRHTGGWDNFEPIWWHSLVGLALITVSRDALSLVHERLKARELASRYVVDKPFVGVDLDSLDLVSDSDPE